MTFGTFIADAYTRDEAKEIADSLEEICSPNDIYGWASSGIYSFWNYYTKEIYYIGLAIDLGERFKQHNGILPTIDNGCKYKQITDYFSKNQKLGYSIFVQSPLSQAQTHRNQNDLHFDEYNEWVNLESKENIKIIEGSFIGAFKKRNGKLPRWNKVEGSIIGSERATLEMYEQLAGCLIGNKYDPLVARSSLREIASDAAFAYYETWLHGIRISMLSRQVSFEQVLREHLEPRSPFNQIYRKIISTNYLEKHPVL